MNFPTKVGEAIYTFKIPPGKRRKATKVLTPHKKTKTNKIFEKYLVHSGEDMKQTETTPTRVAAANTKRNKHKHPDRNKQPNTTETRKRGERGERGRTEPD